jgi:hypothetical protein
MARPRKEGRKLLPNNLYVQKRPSGEYFTYRNPLTGVSRALGYDKAAAIEIAERLNVEVSNDVEAVDRIPEHCGLLSSEQIVSEAYPLGSYPGVYFLLHGTTIVYIGKSLDVEYRIGQHRAQKKISFDAVYTIECPADEISRLEARYIRTLKPPLNSAFPAGISGQVTALEDAGF